MSVPNGNGQSSEPPVFDRAGALERLGGEEELLRELADVFLETIDGQLAELRAAAAGDDETTARRLAHAIKGGASHVGLTCVQQSALTIEMLLAFDPAIVSTAIDALHAAVEQAKFVLAPSTQASSAQTAG